MTRLVKPSNVLTRKQSFHLITALYALQSQVRFVNTTALAHYFTLWRQVVYTHTVLYNESNSHEWSESIDYRGKDSDTSVTTITPVRNVSRLNFDDNLYNNTSQGMPRDIATMTSQNPQGENAVVSSESIPKPLEVEVQQHANAERSASPTTSERTSAHNGYIKQLTKNEDMLRQLADLRTKAGNPEQIEKIRLQGVFAVLLIFMKNCLRRRIEFGFQRWVWVTEKLKASRQLQLQALRLTQDQHKLHAREFQIGRLLNHNTALNNAIQCSHAFFLWKICSTRETMAREALRAEEHRRVIYHELLDLKATLLTSVEEGKSDLRLKLSQGEVIKAGLARLQRNVEEAAALTTSINSSCTGGDYVALSKINAGRDSARARWTLLREVLGVNPYAAERVYNILTTKKGKSASSKSDRKE
jgi:hypothetical protein